MFIIVIVLKKNSRRRKRETSLTCLPRCLLSPTPGQSVLEGKKLTPLLLRLLFKVPPFQPLSHPDRPSQVSCSTRLLSGTFRFNLLILSKSSVTLTGGTRVTVSARFAGSLDKDMAVLWVSGAFSSKTPLAGGGRMIYLGILPQFLLLPIWLPILWAWGVKQSGHEWSFLCNLSGSDQLTEQAEWSHIRKGTRRPKARTLPETH